jgi:hypothetical protein
MPENLTDCGPQSYQNASRETFGDIILDMTNTAGGSQDIEKSRAP